MLNPPNRRIRTRMYGGVGGEEPRGSPLSRLTAASTTAASTAAGLRSPYPTNKPSKGVRERPSRNELTLTRRARPSRDTIKDRASIHDRPKTIESRGEAGHWEGDLIICKCTRPVLVLHERKSRVTLAARLTGKTAAETISAMLAVFGRIDPHLRRSITFDNDTAFAQHGLLRTMRDMTTWFCDAYASWQKGGVENANGRLRRWLPRHLDIDRTSDQDIQEIVLTTNLTPRKCLGFKTPFQAVLAELGKDVQIRFSQPRCASLRNP